MARRRNKTQGLGSLTLCKLTRTAQETIKECGTQDGATLCRGDRVQGKPWGKGTVLGARPSTTNKRETMAVVCWDNAEPGDTADSFGFDEIKKIR